MGKHFTSHTEAMRNLAGELRTEFHRRTDFVREIREQVPLMITKFRDEHYNVAAGLRQRLTDNCKRLTDYGKQRLRQANNDVEARRQFVSQLKSFVYQLKSDFNLERSKIAADLKAASEAWKNRETRQAEFFTKRYQQPSGWPADGEMTKSESDTKSESSSKAKGKKSKSKKSRD